MLNRDIYNKAPKENRLVNNGVAEVSEDHSEAAQAILRYELETFVCDGQYEKGLETILDKFLQGVDDMLPARVVAYDRAKNRATCGAWAFPAPILQPPRTLT